MMLRSITEMATRKLRDMLKNKKGADIVEWVAIIAVAVGIVMIVSPQARSGISSLFATVFSQLNQMVGGN